MVEITATEQNIEKRMKKKNGDSLRVRMKTKNTYVSHSNMDYNLMYQPSCTNNVLKIQVFYIKDFDLIKSSFNTYIDISTYIVYTHTCVCVCVYTHTYE